MESSFLFSSFMPAQIRAVLKKTEVMCSSVVSSGETLEWVFACSCIRDVLLSD